MIVDLNIIMVIHFIVDQMHIIIVVIIITPIPIGRKHVAVTRWFLSLMILSSKRQSPSNDENSPFEKALPWQCSSWIDKSARSVERFVRLFGMDERRATLSWRRPVREKLVDWLDLTRGHVRSWRVDSFSIGLIKLVEKAIEPRFFLSESIPAIVSRKYSCRTSDTSFDFNFKLIETTWSFERMFS